MDNKHRFQNKNCLVKKCKDGFKSSSSNYSTCSDKNTSKNFSVDQTVDSTIDEKNYSVNILDQNLDVITDEDVYVDCNDSEFNLEDSTYANESTKYLEISNLKKSKNQTIDIVIDATNDTSESFEQSDSGHLNTITEELEITRQNSTSIKKSITSCYYDGKWPNTNNIRKPLKRILFENENSVIEDKNVYTVNSKKKSALNNKNKMFKPDHKNTQLNYQNTTESFVKWEKMCEKLDNLTYRHSESFSNSKSYDGDNENTYKTLDDTFLTNHHLFGSNSHKLSQKSKSCESLLEEVKHLPHIFYEKYDEFLKGLSNQIEELRKQKVKCTCHLSESKKSFENTHFTSPCKAGINNLLNIRSPNLKINQDLSKLSPRSPNRSALTPKKREVYSSWRKEIVSPVAEYIKGNRPSPFKSPNRKKN